MSAVKADGSVEVEFLVDSVVGPIFFGKDGYYCQIVLTPGSLTAKTFVGVVTSMGLSVANEEAVTESATITLGANGVTTAWS